jgi:hypothetical protein
VYAEHRTTDFVCLTAGSAAAASVAPVENVFQSAEARKPFIAVAAWGRLKAPVLLLYASGVVADTSDRARAAVKYRLVTPSARLSVVSAANAAAKAVPNAAANAVVKSAVVQYKFVTPCGRASVVLAAKAVSKSACVQYNPPPPPLGVGIKDVSRAFRVSVICLIDCWALRVQTATAC